MAEVSREKASKLRETSKEKRAKRNKDGNRSKQREARKEKQSKQSETEAYKGKLTEAYEVRKIETSNLLVEVTNCISTLSSPQRISLELALKLVKFE